MYQVSALSHRPSLRSSPWLSQAMCVWHVDLESAIKAKDVLCQNNDALLRMTGRSERHDCAMNPEGILSVLT
jgi:hypothetical protein